MFAFKMAACAEAYEDWQDDDDDNNSEGWTEMDQDCEATLTCLFCPKPFKTMAVALEHCKIEHGFDLVTLKKRFAMDEYSYLMLVNFVRRDGTRPEKFENLTCPFWTGHENLVPTLPDDPWLMFDFDCVESPTETEPGPTLFNNDYRVENGIVSMSENTFASWKRQMEYLQNTVDSQSEALETARNDMQVMRKVAQDVVTNTDDDQLKESFLKLRLSHDDGYFSSYSDFGIHHTMLSDKPRTVAYQKAIISNAATISGKVVLDIGCGTGILSMFCAQAGAAKVIAVDQSEIVYYAMDNIRANGMDNVIEVVKGAVETVEISVEKIDIIVSEWMGYFLLYEGMLNSVLAARNKFLKPGGKILPDAFTMYVVGLSDPETYEKRINFWSDVYGFKMTSLRNEVLKEGTILQVEPQTVVTQRAPVLFLDLNTCSPEASTFTSDFVLVCGKQCELTALCGYFDSAFTLPNSVILSTGPDSETTHWRQTVFFLPQPLQVSEGQKIEVRLTCGHKENDPRGLVVTFLINNVSTTYYLD